MSFQIHCPAVQNKRSSEGTQARCTSAHRVPRQAYLLRRPLPVDRATSQPRHPTRCCRRPRCRFLDHHRRPAVDPVVPCHQLRRPGHNSSFPAAAGSSFPASAGSSATRGRRLSADTSRVAALGRHRFFPASDLVGDLKKSPGSCKGLCCTMVQIRFGFGFHTVIWVQTVWNLVCT